MSVQTRTGAEVEIAVALREAVVDALAGAGLADDGPSRLLLLQMIGDNLSHPLLIPDHAVGRNHLIELVSACARLDGGMNALVRAVRTLRPKSLAYERIRRLVREPQVRDLLPATELEPLRELLADTAISQLPTLVRRAAGLAAVPAFDGNAVDALDYLTDLNAGPDGLPPVMLFVELVACQVGGVVGENLTTWNDEQAHRLGFGPVLRARRARVAQVPDDARLHLLVVAQHDGIDPGRCLLSYWRQDDPQEWPPPPGATSTVMVSELEWWVDELVVNAERAWSGHAGTVALEIVLPRALLALPVHRWHKEHDTGNPRPLCLDYPIVVRSLERMRSAQWHRMWRQRWCSLTEDPSPTRIHFGRSADTTTRYRIDALLSDPQWIMMVLTTSPTIEPQQGLDELSAALRSGLPALMWHPLSSSDDLRETIGELVEGGLADLPGRVQTLRRSAFNGRSAVDMDIAQDLVLLWDDPRRLVVFDQSPGTPLKGDIADERERAS
jgi:vWA-MoxR associated protein C-terminal domain/vWA-MoxR associated protein middle region 0/Effector-associated domain 2